jgi:hypothetical protein
LVAVANGSMTATSMVIIAEVTNFFIIGEFLLEVWV